MEIEYTVTVTRVLDVDLTVDAISEAVAEAVREDLASCDLMASLVESLSWKPL
ncbi:MAG: hypothetical protein Q8R28_15170 [Dehalococcoidia bacterium]|nr:hypothetical protein [Dehalococcoidia bacterium]